MLVFTLVGEAPGRQEAEIADFVGPVGGALRDMMREAGIDASRVRLANAIPFRPIERSQRPVSQPKANREGTPSLGGGAS